MEPVLIQLTHRSEQSSVSVHRQIAVGTDSFDDHLPHWGRLELKFYWGGKQRGEKTEITWNTGSAEPSPWETNPSEGLERRGREKPGGWDSSSKANRENILTMKVQLLF